MSRLYAMRSQRRTARDHAVLRHHPDQVPDLIPGMDNVFAPYIRDMGRHADHIACISRCTRDDLRQWLTSVGERMPATSVLPLGCDAPASHAPVSSDRVAALVGRRFLLCVATVEGRKNQQVLAAAYAQLVDAGVAELPLLVIVGAIGHGGQSFVDGVARDPRLAHRVLVLSGLDDAELASLYRHCLFTLYPSFYEGWGLPVSESLAHGKFCIASNGGALVEAGEDFVDYAGPLEPGAWAERIRHYLDDADALAAREADIAHRFRRAPGNSPRSMCWRSRTHGQRRS